MKSLLKNKGSSKVLRYWSGLLVILLFLLPAGACIGAEASPRVEMAGPEGSVPVGNRFTITATVSWQGEGAAVDVSRPSFEVPENAILERSFQKSQTVLQEGVPRSIKQYDLVFIAKDEGRASVGPLSFNAKRDDEEFGLTGSAIDIEIVSWRINIWLIGGIGGAIVLFAVILVYWKRKTKK